MDFSTRLAQRRKEKGLSRDQLGKLVGTSGPIIGRYERAEMKPSIELAAKVAEVLEVSLDWLVGHTDLELNKKMVRRIEEVSKMPQKDQDHVFALLDAFIKQTKLQNVLQ